MQRGGADAQSIVTNSSATMYPGTSLQEIHENAGVPLSKLVLSKPIAEDQSTQGG